MKVELVGGALDGLQLEIKGEPMPMMRFPVPWPTQISEQPIFTPMEPVVRTYARARKVDGKIIYVPWGR